MWGSVCNEHFTIEAANVVCRQLGFDQALDYTPGGYFGQSTGPIHMSNVMCTGNEAFITDCTFSATHSCDHSQDVGIYCQGTYVCMYIRMYKHTVQREIFEDNKFHCFRGFTTTSKINSSKSNYSIESYDSLVDPRNLIREMYRGEIRNLENFLPRRLPAIRYICSSVILLLYLCYRHKT